MARKKISTTVYLESGQVAALRELSERTRVPMSEFIREGIDAVLAMRGQAKPLPAGQPFGAAVS